MIAQLLEPAIRNLIAARNYAALRDTFQDWPPSELAELIAGLPEDERVLVFRVLPHGVAGETFAHFAPGEQESLLKAMGHEEVAKVINEMPADDRTALFEELPGEAVQQLLQLLSPEERKIAQCLLGYPEDTVGRLMTPDYVAVHDGWTNKEVFDYIRAHGQDRETLNVIYVVDERGKLIDDVRIREFLLKPFEARVSEIRDSRFHALRVTDSENTALDSFKRYDRNTLPVIDSEGKLLGIVTIDDVLDAAERETTKEIQKIGGLEALDEPYMTIPFFQMVKKRATWLVILFVGEMLTATAMGVFENEIEKAVVLALFVPLIISSGGNSGSQATTLIIRAMAVGEVRLRDWWTVMQKEIKSGLALGLILGSIGFLRIAVWSAFSRVYGPHWLLVALTVAVSLVGVVLWGSLSGSMLPFLLRRCGLDPATSSAPFVATLVDVTGLVIYFSVAISILRGTVL